MIAKLVTVLQAALVNMPVQTRHPWAQLINGVPHVFVGAGEWKPIVDDTTGAWSYFRMNGNPAVERSQAKGLPCAGLRATFPIRYVAMIDRKTCGDIDGLLLQASADIRAVKVAAQVATGARLVLFQRIAWGVDQGEVKAKLGRALVHLDITVTVEGREECFVDGCGTATDVACVLARALSNTQLATCLGEERLAEICGGAEACPMTVRIYLNGVLEETILNVDPCVDNTVNINGNV